MLRQLHRHSIWQNASLPPVGVEVNLTHPRAKNLLGCWVPHAPGLRGAVYNSPGSAPVLMRDLSVHRRDGQFNRGPIANQTDGKWVVDRAGSGFYLDGGDYGRFDVAAKRATDWDFVGAFTLMCRIRLNVLDTGNASNRVFVGRSDGAGGGSKKWWWAWTLNGYATVPAKRLLLYNVPQPTGEDPRSTVQWDPNTTDIYTMALTRDADKMLRFYVDGSQLGDSVTSTLPMSIPNDLDLSWGFGEDFGSNLAGTFFWMKAWARDLSPQEVLAEHRSPWEMLRLPMSTAGGSAARGARVRAFWY